MALINNQHSTKYFPLLQTHKFDNFYNKQNNLFKLKNKKLKNLKCNCFYSIINPIYIINQVV